MRAFSFLESYKGKDTQAISLNEYNRGTKRLERSRIRDLSSRLLFGNLTASSTIRITTTVVLALLAYSWADYRCLPMS